MSLSVNDHWLFQSMQPLISLLLKLVIWTFMWTYLPIVTLPNSMAVWKHMVWNNMFEDQHMSQDILWMWLSQETLTTLYQISQLMTQDYRTLMGRYHVTISLWYSCLSRETISNKENCVISKLKFIVIKYFKNEKKSLEILNINMTLSDVDNHVELLNNSFISLVDKHAPLLAKTGENQIWQ